MRSSVCAGPRALFAKRLSIRVIAGGVRAGNVPGPSRSTARAMRPTAVVLGGADACPPSPRAVRRSVSVPFSPTPTIAASPTANGSGASTTAPPSSSTSHGTMPRASSVVAISCAAAP